MSRHGADNNKSIFCLWPEIWDLKHCICGLEFKLWFSSMTSSSPCPFCAPLKSCGSFSSWQLSYPIQSLHWVRQTVGISQLCSDLPYLIVACLTLPCPLTLQPVFTWNISISLQSSWLWVIKFINTTQSEKILAGKQRASERMHVFFFIVKVCILSNGLHGCFISIWGPGLTLLASMLG